LIEFDVPWGAGNTNIRNGMHKNSGGTKRINRCGRYKGLNEILNLQLL